MDRNSENRLDIPAILNNIIMRGDTIPPGLNSLLERGISTLQNEPAELRPESRENRPGGLVRLKPGGYFVIIPDLHARMDFFRAAVAWTGFSGRPVIADMADGRAQVICVGDAFHSELRGRDRWLRAKNEWLSGYRSHKFIDQEMRENLGLLEMIIRMKAAFPSQFHFLKGNHENIANEEGEGNFPFRKFVYEGDMVKLWVEKFLGKKALGLIYRWEKSLPLAAEGPDFLVSHCEPGRALSRDEIINAYDYDDVIYNLTWIDNNRAAPGSAASTLENFGIDPAAGRIFGGHRPVNGTYSLRQNGSYVQINTPEKWVVAAFTDMNIFNPERDIISLTDNTLQGTEYGKDTGENR